MAAHDRKVALDTHARFVASAAGFGGDKGGHLQKFYERLANGADGDPAQPAGRPIGLSEIVAMGKRAIADQAAASDVERAEREAEQAAVREMFERHRTGGAYVA
ncbi:hypothetical protein [Sphingomonas yantingensis]|uniref:Uncharacterized protein n=1 Tax=Sphingomonas yantingensis TaxID=1241761 RepID=A0A7W9ASZ9_9SPHN|nr:hypothetical protein [Sphingomonas yantingensis]MBB5700013.1 hypothetical protein [Sphingomonas yantingensis]